VSDAAQNQSFVARVRSVVVRELTGAVPDAPTQVDAVVRASTLDVSWTTPPSSVVPSEHLLAFYSGGPLTMSPLTLVARLTTGPVPGASVPIPPGTQGVFTVRVEAAAGGAVSLPSSPVTFVVGPSAPSAPTGLVGMVNGHAIALAWRNTLASGVPTAIVLDVSGSASTSIPLGVVDAFQFGAVPDGTYTVSVRAINAAGSSASSNPVTLTFPGPCSGVPLPPSDFTVSRDGRVVTAAWNPAAAGPAPTAFVLGVTGAVHGSVTMAGRSISGNATAGSYGISVAGMNACGVGAATPVHTIVVPSTSGS
jgi:hypothetical protein